MREMRLFLKKNLQYHNFSFISLDSKNKQILHIYFVTKKKKVLCFYFIYKIFLGNVLIGVRVVFLPNCHLILFLLKHRSA